MRKKELESQLAALKEQIDSAEVMAEIAESAFTRRLEKEEKDGGWVALDRSATKRNREWKDVEKNLQDAFAVWCVNPLAKSYCDYMRYFVIGKGTQISTDDGDDATDRITYFCELNNWDVLEKQICEELSRDGECFVRFHDKTGRDFEASIAAISLIDPLEVQAIYCPEIGKPEWYLRKYIKTESMSDDGVLTTKPDSEKIDAKNIIHIKVNSSHNELRGRSDLLVAMPAMHQHKRWLDDMSRRNYYLGAINWLVGVLAPIKPSQIKARYPTGPSPGTVIVHDKEKEEWKTSVPDMHQADQSEGARTMKLRVMEAFKMPESWFGDTGESNLATTKALAMPTLRAFMDRQDTLRYYFEEIIKRGARVETVEVTFPEIVSEEMSEKANALKALSDAFINLQTSGLTSKESLFDILSQFVDTLDSWEDDESGPGEKVKIEKEEQEEAVATAQGRSSKGEAGLLYSPMARTGEPGMPPIPVAAGTQAPPV